MNLVRLGHYHIPGPDHGICQTALVVGILSKLGNEHDKGDLVNLAVWDQDGSAMVFRGVEVSEPQSAHSTFHLSGYCPWRR